MTLRYWLIGSLILVPLLVMADKPAAPSPSPLIVEEADAIVELYEIRLHNVKMKSEEEDLKWDMVKETFERMEASHKNGAISERDYRDARYDYNFWKHQDKVKDIEEAETNVKLAKIRQQMARAGLRPYGTIANYGKE